MHSEPAGDRCVFCGAVDVEQTHTGLFHPTRPDHGPFDFYRCGTCGSGLTLPPPAADALARLYASFEDGYQELHRAIMADDPQDGLTELFVDRLAEISGRRSDEAFRWIDVGAGGELAAALAERFPRAEGVAIDQHERPRLLDGITSVRWQTADLNAPDFAERVEAAADVVVAVAVWEHVLRPDAFAANLIRLLDGPGLVYLLAPDYGSVARRLLGRRWPYFTPGEHLFMPTTTGARSCLRREWLRVGSGEEAVRIDARSIAMPYSLRYTARRAGLPIGLGKLIPRALRVGLPAGALEAHLTRS